jgi:hypothetical protein
MYRLDKVFENHCVRDVGVRIMCKETWFGIRAHRSSWSLRWSNEAGSKSWLWPVQNSSPCVSRFDLPPKILESSAEELVWVRLEGSCGKEVPHWSDRQHVVYDSSLHLLWTLDWHSIINYASTDKDRCASSPNRAVRPVANVVCETLAPNGLRVRLVQKANIAVLTQKLVQFQLPAAKTISVRSQPQVFLPVCPRPHSLPHR